MGCIFPKPPVDENSRSNIFKVVNIDQDGNDHLPGKIEVTSENILLHQKKKLPISWPIRTLRRYGYDTNIFSFEAGRRCPTGEGIFAFRCEQAEQLFRLLQTNIQRSCIITHPSTTDSNQASSYLEPRTSRHESVGSQSSCPQTPVSPQVPSSYVYIFDTRNSDYRNDTTVETPNNVSVTSCPLYINVPSTVDDEEVEKETPQNAYMCLTETDDGGFPSPLTPLTLSPMTDEFGRGEQSPKNLQYITLELNSSPSPTVTKLPLLDDEKREPYTTIDFKRTLALVQSTKPNAENDRGCTRRTRHNSTLYGIESSSR